MNEKSGYNQTCRLDGEKVASVMFSACCSHNPCTNIRKVHHSDSDVASVKEAMMDGVESMKMTTMLTPKSRKKKKTTKKKKENYKRHSEGGCGGNLWREKTATNENGDGSNSSSSRVGGGNTKFERSYSTPDFSTLGSIGPSDLLGMALPCTGRQYRNNNSSDAKKSNNNANNDAPHNSDDKYRRRALFASNPLIDPTDSLVERHASFMSLLASATMDTVMTPTDTNTTAATAGVGCGGVDAPPYTYATPPKNPKRYNHSNDDSGTTTITPGVRTPTRSGGGTRTSLTPSDSPAIELSMAKQVANRTQMSNVRKNNREALRDYRSPNNNNNNTTTRRGSGGGCSGIRSAESSPNNNNRAREKSPTPRKGGHHGVERNDETTTAATPAKSVDVDDVDGDDGIEGTRVAKPYSSFENAPLTPIWDGAKDGNVHSELESTYRYPRLYLRDPIRMISEQRGDVTTTTNDDDDDDDDERANNTNKGGSWWFHLAQRMETTLKHVQYNHWKKILLTQQLRQSQRDGGGGGGGNHHHNRVFAHSDSNSAASSSAAHRAFGCAGLEVPNADSNGCVAVPDLCPGGHDQQQQHQQQQHQQQQQRIPYRTGSKSPQRRRSTSKSPMLPSYGNSNRKPTRKGSSSSAGSPPSSAAAPATTAAVSAFRPSAPPLDAWSEPSASTLRVRGKTYAADGIKVESEPSVFSVAGVDSFVRGGCCGKGGGGDGDCDAREEEGSGGFLRRWKGVCEEIGLDCPPFLLIINFIVPWGNFQVYLIRPDADEGPFSSRHKHIPSEKAWREFMEGTTEHRNKRLKLIPRVCAGPWVVKRMVGSTPAIIGTKLPVSYSGSVRENYLKIDLDVTKGPAFGNAVANTVVGKADAVTVDLGFVIEGREEDGHLPERMLGLVRLHHLNMKRAPTHSEWRKELLQRCR